MGVLLWCRRPCFLAFLLLLPFLPLLLPFLLLVCPFAVFSFSLFHCLLKFRPWGEEREYVSREGEGGDQKTKLDTGTFVRKCRNVSAMFGEEREAMSDLECVKLLRVHEYLEEQLRHIALLDCTSFTAPKNIVD